MNNIMLELKQIEREPRIDFNKLKKKGDFIWYQGALMSHFQYDDSPNEHYIMIGATMMFYVIDGLYIKSQIIYY